VPQPGSELDALQAWYYGAPEDPFTGDVVACDFSTYVHCVRVGPDERVVQLDMAQQDPYTRCLYVFYVPLGRGELVVLGTLSFEALRALGGRVDFARTPLERSRCALPPWEFGCALPDDGPVFCLPLVGGGRQAFQPLPWDAVARRALGYVGLAERHRSVEDEEDWCGLATGLVEGALGTLYSIPGTALDMGVLQTRFREARHACECARIAQAWGPRRGQASARRILERSGFRAIEGASGLDRQSFLARHPGREPPAWHLDVFVEDVPGALLRALPVHRGGRAHLTYCDIVPWAQHRFCVQDARARAPTEELPDQARDIARRVARAMLSAPSRGPTKRFAARRPTEAAPEARLPADAALESLVPPCFAQVLRAPRFPRHQQRLRITATLLAAGVPQQLIGDWFERKNAQHPKNVQGARARFDYAQESLRTMGPTYCANVVRDMRSGCSTETHIHCPMDIEDAANFKRACGGGPLQFIQRELRALEARAPPEPKEEEEEDPFPSSSSSSSSSDDE